MRGHNGAQSRQRLLLPWATSPGRGTGSRWAKPRLYWGAGGCQGGLGSTSRRGFALFLFLFARLCVPSLGRNRDRDKVRNHPHGAWPLPQSLLHLFRILGTHVCLVCFSSHRIWDLSRAVSHAGPRHLSSGLRPGWVLLCTKSGEFSCTCPQGPALQPLWWWCGG